MDKFSEIWAYTVVFEANKVAFGAITKVFGGKYSGNLAHKQIFEANTLAFWGSYSDIVG